MFEIYLKKKIEKNFLKKIQLHHVVMCINKYMCFEINLRYRACEIVKLNNNNNNFYK